MPTFEFEFDNHEDSVAGHAAAKAHDTTAAWMGNLRGTGYVVTCDNAVAAMACKMIKGARTIRQP
ncbi:hypothetical protein [Rhizobium sp. LCM 4573]|uniref:hypothetical protein n=1 Tax=Rhizobium sp. LCM 4573 TaxID=1848291 RepID=UPI0008D9AB0C|nr:hypothetical protein [Rhizobium sp. LCM 4573]OHV83670.1 hypothetical protein LCM4573_06070 [Rhizobium sp. LCM 4573]